MATQTTNLGLTKPAGTDKIRIAQINGNMDILDTKIGSVGDTALQAQVSAIENGIAIVSVGNAHAAISSGQFVYVRNHGTLPEGLYTANSAIAANATLSASNVTSTSAGGLNALSDQIAKKTITPTVISGFSSSSCEAYKSGNVVTVMFNATGGTVSLPKWGSVTLITLPEGYRPSATLRQPLLIGTSNNYVDEMLTITSSGAVQIVDDIQGSALTISSIRFVMTFIV